LLSFRGRCSRKHIGREEGVNNAHNGEKSRGYRLQGVQTIRESRECSSDRERETQNER
jgi:hypothetical protein